MKVLTASKSVSYSLALVNQRVSLYDDDEDDEDDGGEKRAARSSVLARC